MELQDFAKILVMDIDLLVTSNIDELFELPAPAACRRGMNQSSWPLKTGSAIDGRPFFMGKDPTKWSWGQGTGINAGVMLWEPDPKVFKEMQAEIIEPNHPEHMKGNGPEQDYLSRFWADAPWTHIGVEYNFQLHQMFFSLHPDCVGKVERSILPQTPEKVKIVHFSGEPTAKPWHRVLDPSFESFWPDRSRDAEYVEMFADEFQGHWLWIKKDPAMWASTAKTTRGWDMEKMFLGEDGKIYRYPEKWAEEKGYGPSLVQSDEAALKGTIDFLATVLGQWFDTLQDLESILSFDLKQALIIAADGDKCLSDGDKNALIKAAKGPPWKVARDSLLSEDASPSQSSHDAKQLEKAPQDTQLPNNSAEISSKPPAEQLPSSGTPSGWSTERSRTGGGQHGEKLSIICGAVDGACFASFVEGGSEVYRSEDDEFSAIFVKVAGPHLARRFDIPQDSAEALASLQLWMDTVPDGAVVLLAIVGLPCNTLSAALTALAPLGVPEAPPPSSCRVLAAIGTAAAHRSHESPGPESWHTTHASCDIAFVSNQR